MSSVKSSFSKGVTAFHAGRYQDALQYFTEALSQQEEQQQQLYYSIYDSRAATYEKLNRLHDALRDVKRAMDIVPSRWQAYARGARLLLQTQRYDAAVKMADRALARLNADSEEGNKANKKASMSAGVHSQRRAELESIKASALRNCANQGSDKGKTNEKETCHARQGSPPQCYISALPTELLADIFSIAITQDHTILSCTILRVCRVWRRTAWNCPALWNTLVLGGGNSRQGPRKRARVWLERSAGRINDLRVCANAIEDSDWCMALEEQLKSLRWHTLHALAVERWDLGKYLKSISSEESLKSLDKLEIVDDIGSGSPRDSLLSAASHLAELSLTRVQLNFDSISSRSLRRVFLSNCNHGQQHIFKILESQPLLETFTVVELPARFLRRWQYDGFLKMDHLTHIDLTMCFSVVLEKLIAPNLRALRLSQSGFALDRAFVHLATLNLPNFEELSLSCVPCQPRPLVTFLETVPTLTSIELTSSLGLAVDVIEALANPENRPAHNSSLLCPRLQHVNVSQSPDIRSATLVRLIKSRLPESRGGPAVSRIHTLRMDGCPRVESDLLPWFRDQIPEVSCIYLSKKAAAWKR